MVSGIDYEVLTSGLVILSFILFFSGWFGAV
jgi:hypothetical protein